MKRMTTRDFLRSLPPKIVVSMAKNLPDDLDSLPRIEKLEIAEQKTYDDDLVIRCNGESLFCGYVITRLMRKGANIFRKTSRTAVITITKNRIRVQEDYNLTPILMALGIEWVRDLDGRWGYFISKSVILRAILTRRIYSEETLTRQVYWRLFRIRIANWRTGRDFILKRADFSLCDLCTYTKDVNKSIEVILKPDVNIQLLYDILKTAILTDEKVDFTWSEKRLMEEHLRQTRSIMRMKFDEASDKPIHESVAEEEDIRCINSERAVFEEGFSMHHCLYTNYKQRILDKSYLAYHMQSPEECTIGIVLTSNGPALDQVFKKYDQPVKLSTKKAVRDFIMRHSESLESMFTVKWPEKDLMSYDDLPF